MSELYSAKKDAVRARTLFTLRRQEGYRGQPYKCSADKLTVGYGTTFPITEEEASWLLARRYDISRAELEARAMTEYEVQVESLPERVQEALTNMAYQLGVPSLMKFRRMWKAIRVRNWQRALEEALDSKWAKHDTPERAREVAALFLPDFDQTRE